MAATIEIYLVRHGLAATRGPKYPDDRLRPLTPAGVKKFAESVPGLDELGVVIDFVLTSPLVRARDTATLLAAGLKPKPAIAEVVARLEGRELATVPTDMTLSPALPAIAAPAHAAESHH